MIDNIGIGNFYIIVIILLFLIGIFKRKIKKIIGICLIILILNNCHILSINTFKPIVTYAINMGKSITNGILNNEYKIYNAQINK